MLAVHLVFDTWKRESNWNRNVSGNFLWDRYRAGQQLDNIFFLSPVTVPQVFPKITRRICTQWIKTGSYNLCV